MFCFLNWVSKTNKHYPRPKTHLAFSYTTFCPHKSFSKLIQLFLEFCMENLWSFHVSLECFGLISNVKFYERMIMSLICRFLFLLWFASSGSVLWTLKKTLFARNNPRDTQTAYLTTQPKSSHSNSENFIRRVQKFFHSKCSFGHVQGNFDNSQHFCKNFRSSCLPNMFHVSHSNNFLFQFVQVPRHYFSVMVVRNQRGSHNKGAGIKSTNAKILDTFLHAFINFCKETFIFFFRKRFFAPGKVLHNFPSKVTSSTITNYEF